MATKELLKIHEVVKYPDPILARKGAPVTVFDDKLRKLVAEMFESMYAAQGIGLAAPDRHRRQLQKESRRKTGPDQP